MIMNYVLTVAGHLHLLAAKPSLGNPFLDFLEILNTPIFKGQLIGLVMGLGAVLAARSKKKKK